MPSEFTQGHHICALYENEDEQLAIAAAFVADGLRNGERCLYAGRSPATVRRFQEVLNSLGIDARAMVTRGALNEATSAETHLAGGGFDAERMLAFLNKGIEAALDAGFQGLRTCGDMSWLLDDPQGPDRVIEYESLLNEFFRGVRALGMCLYDRARLPPSLIDHAIATHSSVSIDGHHRPNQFYELPAIAARRSPEPDKVAWKISELRRPS